MPGDGSLEVQLFIGSLAAAAAALAMAQAGWTHRWFVRGMFAVAIILAATAVGWPKISPHAPEIDAWISNVTDSRLAWFVIGIVLGLVTGFAIGAWLDARLKRRADRAHSDSGSRVPDQTAAPVSDPITDIRTARKLVTEFRASGTGKVGQIVDILDKDGSFDNIRCAIPADMRSKLDQSFTQIDRREHDSFVFIQGLIQALDEAETRVRATAAPL